MVIPINECIAQIHATNVVERSPRMPLSGIRVTRTTAQTYAAITQARRLHEKLGGAPYPDPRPSPGVKLGSRAARVRHEKLGGAPLPPLKKR